MTEEILWYGIVFLGNVSVLIHLIAIIMDRFVYKNLLESVMQPYIEKTFIQFDDSLNQVCLPSSIFWWELKRQVPCNNKKELWANIQRVWYNIPVETQP